MRGAGLSSGSMDVAGEGAVALADGADGGHDLSFSFTQPSSLVAAVWPAVLASADSAFGLHLTPIFFALQAVAGSHLTLPACRQRRCRIFRAAALGNKSQHYLAP